MSSKTARTGRLLVSAAISALNAANVCRFCSWGVNLGGERRSSSESKEERDVFLQQ